jgi:hypothetical protein
VSLFLVEQNAQISAEYQVWASEFPDFPVDSSLHAQDNCLRNVEGADQYVLIVNDRYGAAYEGAAYPKHPLPEDPMRPISVTWYEYLRALHCAKPIRVLVRERIWDQRSVFQTARKSGAELKEAGLPLCALLDAPLSLHDARKDIVDSRQMARPLGPQPFQHVAPDIERNHLLLFQTVPCIPKSRHRRKLLVGERWDIRIIDMRIVARRLPLGGAARRLTLALSKRLVENIFGFHGD